MKCGIVTPVGPGHADLYAAGCRPSIERAWSYDHGPFEDVILYAMDDGEGRHGRSNRRNAAIDRAIEDGVDWLFLLDADDLLAPNAFEAFGRVLAAEPQLDVIWGLICELDAQAEPQLREDQAERIDSYEDFLSFAPAQAVQIGGFYRTRELARWRFDEALDTGEDYTLYLQLWQSARCAKRPEIFFLNRRGQHSTGPRGATGQEWRQATDRLWAEAVGRATLWAEIGTGAASVRMRVADPRDPAQRAHLEGHFFEAEALARLQGLVPRDARIVDVGAKTGNHVLWYARHLAPKAILPVEPAPEAAALLAENIAANGIGGLIDPRGIAPVPDPAAERRAEALDALLGESRVDLLRISPELGAIAVLDGAAQMIARSRPILWVAVPYDHILAFAQRWCRANGYRLAEGIAGLDTMTYIALPEDAPAPQQHEIEEAGA